jgi:hypothetical protein
VGVLRHALLCAEPELAVHIKRLQLHRKSEKQRFYPNYTVISSTDNKMESIVASADYNSRGTKLVDR